MKKCFFTCMMVFYALQLQCMNKNNFVYNDAYWVWLSSNKEYAQKKIEHRYESYDYTALECHLVGSKSDNSLLTKGLFAIDSEWWEVSGDVNTRLIHPFVHVSWTKALCTFQPPNQKHFTFAFPCIILLPKEKKKKKLIFTPFIELKELAGLKIKATVFLNDERIIIFTADEKTYAITPKKLISSALHRFENYRDITFKYAPKDCF